MQIPQNLPQFEEKSTLVIITGTHEARYLTAHKGVLEEIHKFKNEKIRYSDREGHFLRRAFGKVFGSGSVHEPQKEQEMIEFASEFEKQTKKVLASSKPEQIILVCPDYAQNIVKEKLAAEAKNKLSLTILGNYYKTKLPKILTKVKEEMEKNAPPEVMSEEARKILEKGK